MIGLLNKRISALILMATIVSIRRADDWAFEPRAPGAAGPHDHGVSIRRADDWAFEL